jgi:hypothetical protein
MLMIIMTMVMSMMMVMSTMMMRHYRKSPSSTGQINGMEISM